MEKIKIKSIKKLEQEIDRYDLTVPDTHNFFANGILIHNTSGRYGNVILPVEEPVTFWGKLWAKIKPQKPQWGYLQGTRRVLLDDEKPGFYGTNDFRHNVIRDLTLHKGETLYYEIVGWVDETTPIMATVDTTVTKDKEFIKKYGEKMTFKYGCPQGTQDMYVYRITRSNEDGIVTELSWSQLKQRCSELGLKHVPELRQYVFDGDFEQLDSYLDELVEGEDLIDPSHIREGVVIRVDAKSGQHYALKNKSYNFYICEGVIKDQGIADIEDQS